MTDKSKQQRPRARLGHHRDGILAPTDVQLARHTFVQNGHTFIHLGGRRSISNADDQIYVRDKYGGSFNLVRLLLERADRMDLGRAWEHRCGFSECIDITHWAPRLPPSRGAAGRYRLVVLEGDVQLFHNNTRVRRDAVIPAVIAPLMDIAHLARFLYTEGSSRFITACGINIDPATLVLCAKAKCLSCLK